MRKENPRSITEMKAARVLLSHPNEHFPDSDTHNSGDDKNEKHRLLSQVVWPQESRLLSPCHVTEEWQSHWEEAEQKIKQKGKFPEL